MLELTVVPHSIGSSVWEGLVEAVGKWFSKSTAESIKDALNSLRFPTLDPNSRLMDLYDSFFGLGLLVGVLVTAAYLIFVVRYASVRALVEAVKVLPYVYFFGALLPWGVKLLTDLVQAACKGMIESVNNSPYDDKTFSFELTGNFGPINGFLAWVGAQFLNLEFWVFSNYLEVTLSVMIVAFAFRWFGAFGDGIFVVAVGFMLMFVVGVFISVLILVLAWATFSTPGVVSPVGPWGIMAPMVLAACAPFVILVIYLKTGLSTKVRGVMESRQLSAKVSRFSGADAAGGGGASTAAAATAGGAMTAFYLNRRNANRSETSPADGRRDAASTAMSAGAATVAKSQPVTAAAMYVGSKVVKPRQKPTPQPGPTVQTPPEHPRAQSRPTESPKRPPTSPNRPKERDS